MNKQVSEAMAKRLAARSPAAKTSTTDMRASNGNAYKTQAKDDHPFSGSGSRQDVLTKFNKSIADRLNKKKIGRDQTTI
jgi:hypothetical protein